MVEGAKEATGVAVIIDVFRAFTVEAYIMNNGADKIIPVADLETAYKLKEDNPNIVLVGERHGKIMKGFDFGNSPSQIENTDFSNKIVVHTTSAGTQGITNAKNANILKIIIIPPFLIQIKNSCMSTKGRTTVRSAVPPYLLYNKHYFI